MNKWKQIWQGRKSDDCVLHGGFEETVCELKRINGFDVIEGGMNFESFHDQYIQIKNELSHGSRGKYALSSIFEIGCGSGANLYFFQKDNYKVGGIDYSSALIDIAKDILPDALELLCCEANNTPVGIVYDAVLSNSVFSYFQSYEYAEQVLELMLKKANYSIGILDVHDPKKKEEFIRYRKQNVENYEERYADLQKFFYDKQFFLDFAEMHRLNIRFTYSDIKGYWNNEFIYNVFMTKDVAKNI